MSNRNMLIGLVAVVVLASVLVIVYSPGEVPETKPKPAPTPKAAPAPEEPLITKAEYDALRSGMTYGQVLEIIGDMETENRSEYDRGVPGYTAPVSTAWYTWRNADGSSARLAFISNKLDQKAEDGLK